MPDEVWDAINSEDLNERLAAMSACVMQLYKLLVEPEPPRRTRKRIPEGLAKAANHSAAFRARVGRAAARMGMDLDEFVAEYGWIDRLPQPKGAA